MARFKWRGGAPERERDAVANGLERAPLLMAGWRSGVVGRAVHHFLGELGRVVSVAPCMAPRRGFAAALMNLRLRAGRQLTASETRASEVEGAVGRS